MVEVEERIRRLERSTRRWKMGILIAVALAALGQGARKMAAPKPKDVVFRSITFVNQEGREIGFIGLDCPNMPGSHPTRTEEGFWLVIWDSNTSPREERLRLDVHGLCVVEGKQRAELYASEGAAFVEVGSRDMEPKDCVHMMTDEQGPRIRVAGEAVSPKY